MFSLCWDHRLILAMMSAIEKHHYFLILLRLDSAESCKVEWGLGFINKEKVKRFLTLFILKSVNTVYLVEYYTRHYSERRRGISYSPTTDLTWAVSCLFLSAELLTRSKGDYQDIQASLLDCPSFASTDLERLWAPFNTSGTVYEETETDRDPHQPFHWPALE